MGKAGYSLADHSELKEMHITDKIKAMRVCIPMQPSGDEYDVVFEQEQTVLFDSALLNLN